MDIRRLIVDYVSAKEAAKKSESAAKKQRRKILDYLEENKLEYIEHDGVKVYSQHRETDKLNEDGLTKWLEDNGFSEQVFDTVKVLNYDKLEELLYNEDIKVEDIAEFTEVSVTEVLKYSMEKK